MNVQWKPALVAALAAGLSIGLASPSTHAADRFSKLVGNVAVGNVAASGTYDLPYITWGGDMVTFHANGGKTTSRGSVFAGLGLSYNLVAGDDFVGQVRNYLAGKTPFLRGTFRMMAQASEVLNKDPRTKPVVAMQMTWSAGDHLVARRDVRRLTDLKGKTIALQQGGPHVGMLDDILQTAGLKWSDVKIKWLKDLTGSPQSPAAVFKADSSVAACAVITPDMIGLTGGLDSRGSGAEGTVRGAHVLMSTAHLSHSIADVYVVRKDFADKHPDVVTKFVAGYLKAAEQVLEGKRRKSADYRKLLNLTMSIYGTDVIPNAEEANGLFEDCKVVGHPGNVKFFTAKGTLHGFEDFNKAGVRLAVEEGYAAAKAPLLPSPLDWSKVASVGGLRKTEATGGSRFDSEVVADELERLNATGGLDDKIRYSFTISFEPNTSEFSAATYGSKFDEALKMAAKFGNAVIAIRGHADPTKTLATLVRACVNREVITRRGSSGNWRYFFRDGTQLDLNSTERVVKLIKSGRCDGSATQNPRAVMQAARNLSRKRAEQVRLSVIGYAKRSGIDVDATQLRAQGVGIAEPLVPKPRNMDDVRQNTRVEFAIVAISAEARKDSDFDF